MATPKFEYPATGAGATTTLEFTRGGFLRDVRVATANIAVEESETGDIQTKVLGDEKWEQTFTVQVPIADQGGDTADITKLANFVTDDIEWSSNGFYFTDTDGNEYFVKLLNQDLSYKPYVNYREYVLHLREVS